MQEQYAGEQLELSPTQFALGDFVFSLPENTPVASMGRKFDGGWTVIDLLNELPMQQQTGRKLDELTLKCEWFGDEGVSAIARLSALRDEGKPYTLIRGDGASMGQWVLVSFDTDESWVYQEGKSMKQAVTINLREFANRPLSAKAAGQEKRSRGKNQ